MTGRHYRHHVAQIRSLAASEQNAALQSPAHQDHARIRGP